jgi:D-alanyl-D-alanine carboxypeptidase
MEGNTLGSRIKRSRSKAAVALTAIGLVAGACGGTAAVPTTTGPTTTTTAVAPPVDEAFLAEQVSGVSIPESGGAFMVAVVAGDGEVVYAAKGTDPDGNAPTPGSPFRVASITKLFTALVTLSLVDGGLVDLDAPAVDYVTRVPVPETVTVRDLLQHTSGIPEFFDDPSYETWLADPGRVWTPEESVELIAGMEPVLPPGSEFHWGYSNTNYIVLGVLIEEVTDRSFAEVVRARIIEPLGMDGTYLAGFEDGPAVFGAYVSLSPGEPAEPVDFDYTSIATSTSAAGGIVSTALDLHTLFTALFEGQIVSAGSLAEMIGNPRDSALSEMGNESNYGLGIQIWSRFGGRRVEGLVGHGGDIVGYRTLVAHAPERETTAFWVATSNLVDPSPTYAAVVERVGGTQ